MYVGTKIWLMHVFSLMCCRALLRVLNAACLLPKMSVAHKLEILVSSTFCDAPWALRSLEPTHCRQMSTVFFNDGPDSLNHSLYLIKLFNSSHPEGNFGRSQLLDGSISLSPLYPHMMNLNYFTFSNLSVASATGFHAGVWGPMQRPKDAHVCANFKFWYQMFGNLISNDHWISICIPCIRVYETLGWEG